MTTSICAFVASGACLLPSLTEILETVPRTAASMHQYLACTITEHWTFLILTSTRQPALTREREALPGLQQLFKTWLLEHESQAVADKSRVPPNQVRRTADVAALHESTSKNQKQGLWSDTCWLQPMTRWGGRTRNAKATTQKSLKSSQDHACSLYQPEALLTARPCCYQLATRTWCWWLQLTRQNVEQHHCRRVARNPFVWPAGQHHLLPHPAACGHRGQPTCHHSRLLHYQTPSHKTPRPWPGTGHPGLSRSLLSGLCPPAECGGYVAITDDALQLCVCIPGLFRKCVPQAAVPGPSRHISGSLCGTSPTFEVPQCQLSQNNEDRTFTDTDCQRWNNSFDHGICGRRPRPTTHLAVLCLRMARSVSHWLCPCVHHWFHFLLGVCCFHW